MYIGTNELEKVYLGTTELEKIYLGSNVVFDSHPAPVSSKIYSGFSDSNYIIIPSPWNKTQPAVDPSSIQIITKAKLSNWVASTYYPIMTTDSSSNNGRFYLALRAISDYYRISGNVYDYSSVAWQFSSSDFYEQGVELMIRTQFPNSSNKWTLEHSIDNGATWVLDAEKESSGVTDRPWLGYYQNDFKVGCNYSGSAFFGSNEIHLADFKIIADGVTLFDGSTAVAGTDYQIVGTLIEE